MKYLLAIILFGPLFLSSKSWAEYRVFQYYVKSNNKFSMDRSAYLVTSTMDPVTYQSYHGGESAIDVDLVRTWTCPGDTSQFKPLCPSPLEVMEKGEAKN